LECRWCEQASSPEACRAELYWRFGLGYPPGGRPGEIHLPKDLDGVFIKVEIDAVDPKTFSPTPVLWYGVVRHDARKHDGDLERQDLPNTRIASGHQTFTVFGLESLLAQTVIRSAVCLDPTSAPDAAPAERKIVRVGRGLTFNVGARRTMSCEPNQVRGNRSTNTGPHGRYVFGAQIKPGENDELWKIDEIVDHLLEYHATRTGEGVADEPMPPFYVDYAWGQASALQVEAGEVATHGRTVWDVLCELIHRTRLLSFRCDVEPGAEGEPDQILLRVFSLSDQELILPDGSILPANAPGPLDFGRAVDVQEAVTAYDATATYDRVIVTGARRVSVFTCAGRQEGETQATVPLVKGWTPAEEEAYEVGATEAEDYDDLSEEEQAERDSLLREEDRLRAVYSRFLLSPEFRGVIGAGDDAKGVCPPPTINAEVDPPTVAATVKECEPAWRPGLRLLRQLPLLERHDYSESRIADGVEDMGPAEPLRPIVWLRIKAPVAASGEGEDATPATPARYAHVERLSAASADGVGIAWEAAVRTLDDDLGLAVDVRGASQWQLAGGDFSSAIPGETPQADWKDLVATVAVEWDSPLRVGYPAAPGLGGRDRLRVLEIEIPDARLDYVVPGTWVEVRDGRPLTSEGGFLQRPKGTPDWLRALRVARLAYEWYRYPRRSFSFRFRQVSGLFRVGAMIGSIQVGADELAVRTVVTSCRWDLAGGATSLSTSFAELEGRSFF
ncbi:MAG TPA: hypothetical protein VGE52_04235, partial [Pirellulales bacterium]